jgi:hypothetical protein
MKYTGRKWLNCIVVALTLWFRNHGRTGLGIRRSVGLSGMVPHAFHLKECRITIAPGHRRSHLIVVDYIPRKRKGTITDAGDSFVVFKGLYRARIYVEVAQSCSDTLFGAYRDALYRTRGEYAKPEGPVTLTKASDSN